MDRARVKYVETSYLQIDLVASTIGRKCSRIYWQRDRTVVMSRYQVRMPLQMWLSVSREGKAILSELHVANEKRAANQEVLPQE
jgi:hypothetical protein